MTLDEDLNIEYADINEANRQIKLLINEKNKILEHIMSRTCENCKHMVEKEDGFACLNTLSIGWWCDEGVTLTDTCKRFERKEL